jgi:AraC family transcriptional regulator, transcriptional activator of pobA
MIEIYNFDNSKILKLPRRILKYVLVLCTSGTATIVVDENEFELSANMIITITSGQIHYFKKINGAKGIILEFTYDFFCKGDNDIELIFHNGLFCHFAMNEAIRLDNTQTIKQELNQIEKEASEKPYQYQISIHSRIELILVEINRFKINRGDEIWKPDALFLKFLEAVLKNFEKSLTLKKIAAIIGTTESKLNELSKLHTNKTAQNVIYSLMVSEAKRLITYEKLSVKEVAYLLGFNNPFYFSSFFKKHTKLSPKFYKEKFSA